MLEGFFRTLKGLLKRGGDEFSSLFFLFAVYFGASSALQIYPERELGVRYAEFSVLALDLLLALRMYHRRSVGWAVRAVLLFLAVLHGEYLISFVLQPSIEGWLGPVTRYCWVAWGLQAVLLLGPLGERLPLKALLPTRQEWASLLLCLPLVLNIVSANSDYFEGVRESFAFVARVMLVSGFAFFTARLLNRRATGDSLGAWSMIAGLWLFLARPGLLGLFHLPLVRSLGLQFALLFGVGALARLTGAEVRAKLPALGLILSLTAFSQVLFSKSRTEEAVEKSPSASAVHADNDDISWVPPFRIKPDIYLLVYDAYVPQEVMSRYGIDNSAQMDWLREQGFNLVPETYSIGPDSRRSMSRVLDLTDQPGRPIAGANTAARILRREEYQLGLVLNPYLLQGEKNPYWDQVYPAAGDPAVEVRNGILEGEFRSNLVYEGFTYEDWLARKRQWISGGAGGPRFLYAHSQYPSHSQISGRCLSDEIQAYERRLQIANTEMRADIETIRNTGRPALIFVLGDHGPYLTGDCRKLQGRKLGQVSAFELVDRYGQLTAFLWPKGIEPPQSTDIRILQDVLFAAFASLSGERKVLEQRMETSTIGIGPAIPKRGGVRDGVVQVGTDQGKPLYSRD